MITREEIQKIQSIFMHLQIGGKDTPQFYNPDEEYRKHVTIAKGMKGSNSSATEVYCHTEKFTAWHKRIWEKLKKEIPHEAVLIYIEEAKVWRVGFRILQGKN